MITNVHVDCINHDRTSAAAGFSYGEFRYHIWFNPKIGRGSISDTLHKNPIDEKSKIRHQSCDPKAKTNAPLLAEMWRQIEEGRLIAKALAAQDMDDLQEEAERENSAFDNNISEHGFELLTVLKALLAVIETLKWGQSYPGRPHAEADSAAAVIAKCRRPV